MTTERTNDFDEAQGAGQATDDPMRSSADWSTATADLDDTAAISTGGQEPTATVDDLGTGLGDLATGSAYGATGDTAGSDWTAAGGGTGAGDYGTGSDATLGAGYGTTGSSSMSGGDRLGDAASGVADRATSTVETVASQGMSRAGDTLTEVANAIRQSGQQLREEQPQIAGFVDTAAEQVDKAGDFLRQSDLQDVVYRVEDIARRQPALFIGGAFVLGLVAARLLKTSAGGGSGQGFSSGSSYRDLGYGAGATGYGTTGGGYTSRTVDYTGTSDYAGATSDYGARR